MPEFLAICRASLARKHFIESAMDLGLPSHLQNWASSPSLHSQTCPYRKQSFCTTFWPFARILPSFFLSFTCHCFDGKLKKLLPWLSLYVPPRGSLQKRSLCFYVLNTFWPIRLTDNDVRCNKLDYWSTYGGNLVNWMLVWNLIIKLSSDYNIIMHDECRYGILLKHTLVRKP